MASRIDFQEKLSIIASYSNDWAEEFSKFLSQRGYTVTKDEETISEMDQENEVNCPDQEEIKTQLQALILQVKSIGERLDKMDA